VKGRGRILVCVLAVVVLAAALGAIAAGGARDAAAASCTEAQQQASSAALAVFRTAMPARQRAFNATHRSAAARRAFGAAQRKRLASLVGVAACTPISPSDAPCSPELHFVNGTFNEAGRDVRALGVRGELKTAVLFVDFPDAPAVQSASALYDRLVPPAVDWLGAVTYGRLTLSAPRLPTWYRMPRPAGSYSIDFGGSPSAFTSFVSDAVGAAQSQVDFAAYDLLYVVPSVRIGHADGEAYFGSSLVVNGSATRHVVALVAPDVDYHVLDHELGHELGLPDLYSYADVASAVGIFQYAGGWDVMSDADVGASYIGWEKWLERWIDPEQIRCADRGGESIEVTVQPLESVGGVKLLVVPVSDAKLYAVEVRQQTGVDAGLCDHGVLVYTVDGSVATGDGPVQVMTASTAHDSVRLRACGNRYDAALGVGAGETASYEDDAVRVDVLSANADGSYRVRVTKK